MRIVIPTRGRTDQQRTFSFLPPELRAFTDIVCPAKEIKFFNEWRNDVNAIAQPDPEMTITKKRAWIMEEWHRRGHDKIVMLDDDLEWFVRIKEGDWHLRYVTPKDMVYWFSELANKLGKEIPHAGFGPRQGNNRVEPGWASPGRQMYVLGYFLPVVLQECELGRIENREDMDVTLQLLRKGYPNEICHTITASQYGYARGTGGCDGQRTINQANDDANRLAELHPGYVRVVQKEYKASIPRLEVVCSWAKALRDGQQWRSIQTGSR